MRLVNFGTPIRFLKGSQFIAHASSQAAVTIKELQPLMQNTYQVEFLFGAEARNYVDLLYKGKCRPESGQMQSAKSGSKVKLGKCCARLAPTLLCAKKLCLRCRQGNARLAFRWWRARLRRRDDLFLSLDCADSHRLTELDLCQSVDLRREGTRGSPFSPSQHREPQCGSRQKHAHREVKNSHSRADAEPVSQGSAKPRPGDKAADCSNREYDDNDGNADERRMVRHERSGGRRREHPCLRIGILKRSRLPERKRFHGGPFGPLASYIRARELPGDEKQIGNAGPLDHGCDKWIGEQESRDADSADDQQARKSKGHSKYMRQRGAKTVIRTGYRCDHVVGTRRERTHERQYCQREQLFERHCQFYSVLQLTRQVAPGLTRRRIKRRSVLSIQTG